MFDSFNPFRSRLNKDIQQVVDGNIAKSRITNRIPNVFHVCFGFDKSRNDFNIVHYICVRSILEVNRPDKILAYHMYEPQSRWWNKCKAYLTLVQIDDFSVYEGRRVSHYAHKADIIRLQALYENGGIYVDLDTICARPYTDLLKGYDVVLGRQRKSFGTYGLCNATILAAKGAPFIEQWLKCYSFFDRTRWDQHSVTVPMRLARLLPEFLTIMPEEAFFYPSWKRAHLKRLFLETHSFPKAYSFHLWQSISYPYLEGLTEEIIRTRNSTYNLLARKFI